MPILNNVARLSLPLKLAEHDASAPELGVPYAGRSKPVAASKNRFDRSSRLVDSTAFMIGYPALLLVYSFRLLAGCGSASRRPHIRMGRALFLSSGKDRQIGGTETPLARLDLLTRSCHKQRFVASPR